MRQILLRLAASLACWFVHAAAHAVCSLTVTANPSPTVSFAPTRAGSGTISSITGTVPLATGTITLADCTGNRMIADLANGETTSSRNAAGPGSSTSSTLHYRLLNGANSSAPVWGDDNSNAGNYMSVSNTSNSSAIYSFAIDDGGNNNLLPPGAYTKNVTIRLRNGNSGTDVTSATLAVSINVPNYCELDAIQNLLLNYTSLQSGTANASTNFKTYCNISYDIGLKGTNNSISGSISGNLLGLDYSLALTPSGNGQTASPTGSTHTLAANIISGLAGSWSAACTASHVSICSASQVHEIQVSY